MTRLDLVATEWLRLADVDMCQCYVKPTNLASMRLYIPVHCHVTTSESEREVLVETAKREFRQQLEGLRAELNAMDLGDA